MTIPDPTSTSFEQTVRQQLGMTSMGEEQAIAAILAAHEKELIDRGAALYNAGYDIALAAASQMANERVVEARLKDARFFIENRDEKVDYIQDMQDVVAALTDNKGEAE